MGRTRQSRHAAAVSLADLPPRLPRTRRLYRNARFDGPRHPHICRRDTAEHDGSEKEEGEEGAGDGRNSMELPAWIVCHRYQFLSPSLSGAGL